MGPVHERLNRTADFVRCHGPHWSITRSYRRGRPQGILPCQGRRRSYAGVAQLQKDFAAVAVSRVGHACQAIDEPILVHGHLPSTGPTFGADERVAGNDQAYFALC